jgi:hypothetical protein
MREPTLKIPQNISFFPSLTHEAPNCSSYNNSQNDYKVGKFMLETYQHQMLELLGKWLNNKIKH